jgi:hypothetical protein
LRKPGQCAQATRGPAYVGCLPACSDLDKVSSRVSADSTPESPRRPAQRSRTGKSADRPQSPTFPRRSIVFSTVMLRPGWVPASPTTTPRAMAAKLYPAGPVMHCPFASHLPRRREPTGAYRASPSRSHVRSTHVRNRREIAGTAARSIGSLASPRSLVS